MKINLSENSKIYLVCPANFATGGTEGIHQLAFKLQKLGFPRVFLFYLNTTQDNPVHPQFEKYQIKYITKIDDEIDHLLIVPEIHTSLLYKYKHLQKAIWWLSVDNFLISKRLNSSIYYKIKSLIIKRKLILPKRLFSFREKATEKIHHFYQSEFAREFLIKNGVDQRLWSLSDYLNLSFKERKFSESKRKNQIVYNPKKGIEFTQKLISLRPDWSWVPIENMSPEEVGDLLGESKVYIDFGNHPGKDRLPREAAVSGCCIVTGRQGSAGNSIDIPIADKYKFDEKHTSFESILSQIDHLLKNYSEAILDFDTYRSKIREDEKIFEDCIKQIFEFSSTNPK